MRRRAKKVDQIKHFKKRMSERYDIQLNHDQYQELLRKAKSSKVLEKQSLRVSLREVHYQGETLEVIYDSMRGALVTVLPKPEDRYPLNTGSFMYDDG